MDSLITAAARALAAGDVLGALNRVALREDPPALALRGIAMARLGDFAQAKALLRRAGRGFGAREGVERARCVVAEAEIALVSRELGFPEKALAAARATLEASGDYLNAAHARHLAVRRLVLIGRIDEAEGVLDGLDGTRLPAAWRAAHELVVAGIALRRLHALVARDALARAEGAAREAGIPALSAEVENACVVLTSPAARLTSGGAERVLTLEEVEAVLGSGVLVVDACRHAVRQAGTVVSLATRPVLFALLRCLAQAWPDDVTRAQLLARGFGARVDDDSHRARLRVEMGRLRAELGGLAEPRATRRGFVLVPADDKDVVVLAPAVEAAHAPVLALLADGEAWSSSALALALGISARSVQRALEALADDGKVQWFGRGKARRWMTPPVPGFPTSLLLPWVPPGG
jgi:hypothetical protein